MFKLKEIHIQNKTTIPKFQVVDLVYWLPVSSTMPQLSILNFLSVSTCLRKREIMPALLTPSL